MDTGKERINKELTSIEPDAIIELFEVDFSSLQNHVDMLKLSDHLNLGAEPIYRFHSGKNFTNPIYWQDKAYQPLPIVMEEFESKSDGTLPHPKLSILNVDGLLSRIVSSNDDFVGCKVTRKRTFAKFLDAQNFQNRNLNDDTNENPFGGSADPQAHLPDDVFFINRKVLENKEALQFELSSALELGHTQLPGRTVLHNYCTWKYRCSIGCRYNNLPKADVNDKNFVVKRDENGEIIQEGYGLTTLRVVDMVDVFEWNQYGVQRVVDELSGAISWTRGAVGGEFGYERGDVVRISPTYSQSLTDDVPMVFVCIKSHSNPDKFHPLNSTNIWVRDNCSRNLRGCISRFGYKEPVTLDEDTRVPVLTDPDATPLNQDVGGIDGRLERKPMNLPFGGFPGTSRYGF